MSAASSCCTSQRNPEGRGKQCLYDAIVVVAAAARATGRRGAGADPGPQGACTAVTVTLKRNAAHDRHVPCGDVTSRHVTTLRRGSLTALHEQHSPFPLRQGGGGQDQVAAWSVAGSALLCSAQHNPTQTTQAGPTQVGRPRAGRCGTVRRGAARRGEARCGAASRSGGRRGAGTERGERGTPR